MLPKTLMRSMVDELRSAESPEDLDWILSELIAGGPLEGFLAAAIPAPPLAELLYTDEPPSLQELLYGRLLPPAAQEALYAGHVSSLVLLTLLDERPLPPWLRTELRRKLVDNQHQYFRLLVAYAKKEGVELPEPLASIEPLDLDAADREAEREHQAVDSYLDGRRASPPPFSTSR